MADKWMEDRDRRMRERDGRGLDQYGRRDHWRDDASQMGGADREGEDRSWRRREKHDHEGPVDYRGPGGLQRGFGAPMDYTQRNEFDPRRRVGEGGWTDRRAATMGYDGPRFDTNDDDLDDQGYERGWASRDPGQERDHGERNRYGSHEGDSRTERRPRDFLQRAAGAMSSWLGGEARPDERPRTQSAESGRGYRGRGPSGYKRSDERISEEAHERLTDDPWLDASGVSLTVSAGEVTLSGTVPDRESKHRAERVVEEISGVEHVQNNLRVDKGNFLTRPASGYGDSAVEAQMRRDDPSAAPSTGTASPRAKPSN